MKYLKTYKESNYINPDTIEQNKDWNDIDENYEFKNKCCKLLERYGEDVKINNLDVRRLLINIKGNELTDIPLKVRTNFNMLPSLQPLKDYKIMFSLLKNHKLLEIFLIDDNDSYTFLANNNADIAVLWKIREYILDPDLDAILQAKQLNIL